MTETISPGRMALLQLITKHPGVSREKLLAIKGVTEADLGYLLKLDLIREREAGQFRTTHFGEMALKRGL